MRMKWKAILLLTATALFALFLHRIGFFDEPSSLGRLATALFPAPVRFNLMVLGIVLPLYIAWRMLRSRLDRPK